MESLEGSRMMKRPAKSFWKHRPVLVTGCTGLLGSWLSQRLVAEGASVVGLVRDWVPQSNLILSGTIEKMTLVRGEVENYKLIERTLNEYEIETVFHLAAQTLVGTANRSPLSTFESNIKGTWTLLEACRHTSHVKRIVVASSDKAYGIQKDLPYHEGHPLQGTFPYDVSKSCADLLCHSYAATYRLPICITRCGNFYGGGDLNLSRIVPGTIVSVLRGERPVIRSNGKLIRDYLYIEDGVDAYLHLARSMNESRLHGQAFNFSTEHPVSVQTVVMSILRLMGSDLKPIVLNRATHEIPAQYLSAAKARRLLRWSSRFPLDEGLNKTLAWYQAHHSDIAS
jgi:CDP-glucose 4,6-dehydratase